MTKRTIDNNGWLEVKDNPISKVGIFPYLGSEIGASDAGKIYQVYRPQSELENEETIKSFRLIPFVNEHQMLGKDASPAEKKGIQGTTGETVYFEYPYLKSNIKIHSDSALGLIDNGKIELSPGYRCSYEFTSGEFNGQKYDAVQRNIIGNHLALVKEGRTGPDVSVQDHLIFTIDSKELLNMEFTPEQLEQINKLIAEALAAKATDEDPEKEKAKDQNPDEKAKDEDPEKKVADKEPKNPTNGVEDEENKEGGEVEKAAAEKAAGVATEKADEIAEAVSAVAEALEGDPAAAEALDSLNKLMKAKGIKKSVSTGDSKSVIALKAEVALLKKQVAAVDTGAIIKQVAGRDALYTKLKPHTGVFACDSMTALDVANYGLKHLGLTAPKGAEIAVLDSFISGRQIQKDAQDGATESGSALTNWENKENK